MKLGCVLIHNVLSKLKILLLLRRFGFGLDSIGNKLCLEHVIELVCKRRQVPTVAIFHKSRSDNSFEELTLQNNFRWSVNIIHLNFQLFNQGFVVLPSLRLIFNAKVVVVVDIFHNLTDVFVARGLSIKTVHKIELSNIVWSEQSKVVFLALVVDSIELGK